MWHIEQSGPYSQAGWEWAIQCNPNYTSEHTWKHAMKCIWQHVFKLFLCSVMYSIQHTKLHENDSNLDIVAVHRTLSCQVSKMLRITIAQAASLWVTCRVRSFFLVQFQVLPIEEDRMGWTLSIAVNKEYKNWISSVQSIEIGLSLSYDISVDCMYYGGVLRFNLNSTCRYTVPFA